MIEVMNVLWVFAHPEPRSLGGALRDDGLRTLRELGHDVRESDLYAMKWNPVVDAADFGTVAGDERLVVGATSARAYAGGELSADIVAEHEKLAWADAVVVQFPLWWYGMPAILKGWFDRVFVKGFGYGVRADDGRTLRYGEGKLAGKRAMVVLSAGAREPALGPRGINGPLNDILFPLHHGTLFYAGMSVLPRSRCTARTACRRRSSPSPKTCCARDCPLWTPRGHWGSAPRTAATTTTTSSSAPPTRPAAPASPSTSADVP